MHRNLGPWADDTTLIDYLRELEKEIEVITGLLTEEQKASVKIIMEDLREDSLMLDPDIWHGLEEN